MRKALRDKIIASDQANNNVKALFENFEKRTGRRLAVSSSFGTHVVFEGIHPHEWPTKEFKNTFTSFVEMEQYFRKALSETN